MSRHEWIAMQAPEISPYNGDDRSWMHLSLPGTSPIKRKPLPYEVVDSSSPNSPPVPPSASKWGITWPAPALCLSSYISGILLAAGNHIYFTRLHNTPYDNVEWVGRWSLVLAILVKACFATCILICYEQVVWMGFKHREKGTTIRAIDALFGATYQVLSLLQISMWKSHPIAALMITMRWLLPLISIVSPTTLTVQIRESIASADCQVPTLQLSLDTYAQPDLLRSPGATETEGTYRYDLMLSDYTGNSWRPSAQATKIGTLTGLLGEPVNYQSPCGFNCTYNLEFNAPLWQCHATDPQNKTSPWERDNSTSAPWASWNEDSPFQYTSLYRYIAERTNDTGILWLGHLYIKNSTAIDFEDEYGVETFYCEGHNSSVSLEQTFMNGEQQRPRVLNITHGPVVNWTQGFQWASDNDVYGQDLRRHQTTYDLLSSLFEGSVSTEFRSNGDYISETSILNMGAFIKPPLVSSGVRNADIRDEIRGLAEELSLNYTLSLLAFPEILTRQMQTSNCTTTTFSNVWRYQPQNLIIAYALAIFCAFISLVLGGMALGWNGMVSEISFSQVLVTTRNPELDLLARGNCLGRSNIQPKTLYRKSLRLGELRQRDGLLSASGAAHAAFGSPDTVVPLRRKGYYI